MCSLAMSKISQLMPYYGGAITNEEWINAAINKYIIKRDYRDITMGAFYRDYYFLAFHTPSQRDDFMKHNERLVKDYLMLD